MYKQKVVYFVYLILSALKSCEKIGHVHDVSSKCLTQDVISFRINISCMKDKCSLDKTYARREMEMILT